MKHLGVSALLLALGPFLGGCDEERNQYAPPPPPTVTVSPPVQKDVIDYLEFTGTTEAVESVEIRARVKGYLEEIKFEEGDYVDAGALLYVIEQTEYEQAVRSAEASVKAAQAALDLANATLQRMEEAVKTNAVSVLDVLESKAKRDGAAAAVDEVNATLDNAKLNLEYTTIKAPIAGRIGRSEIDKGNLVGAGENTLLTTIVQYDPIEAYFDMSERDLLTLMAQKRAEQGGDEVGNLKAVRATPLELGLQNEDGYPHNGNVHYVDSGVDPGTGTLLFRGRFPNPQPFNLFPGLFCRIRVPCSEASGALLVPEAALGQDQGGWYVLVVDGENVVQHRRVVTGRKVDELIVITSGLEPGDNVVVNGILRARPGAKVTPQRQDASSPAAAPSAPAPSAPAPSAPAPSAGGSSGN